MLLIASLRLAESLRILTSLFKRHFKYPGVLGSLVVLCDVRGKEKAGAAFLAYIDLVQPERSSGHVIIPTHSWWATSRLLIKNAV
jgi:hypothetical protein